MSEIYIFIIELISMETMLIVTLVILGLAFLFFIINTIRCHFQRPTVDDDDTPTPKYHDLM